MMFGRRKKSAPPRLTLWGADGETLYDGRLTGFRLRDETVVALSIHFFNDPEPCEIHRGAVMSRVFTEMEEALGGGATVDIRDAGVPADYFSAYPSARSVRLTPGDA